MNVRVHFLPSNRSVDVRPGTTLLEAARRAALPMAAACSGGALCGRCAVDVLDGGTALPAETPAEAEAKRRNRVPDEQRLACCVAPRAPVTLRARYW